MGERARRALAILGATLLVMVLAPARPGVAAAADERPAFQITTRAEAVSYLRSIGVDPSTAVFQQGTNNYAGPSCPGEGWTCTTTRGPVVQLAQGGANLFQCSGAMNGNTCTVVQGGPGVNDARCTMDSSAAVETQRCSITQTNTNATNTAYVELNITTTVGALQDAFQEATLSQFNGSGNNALTLRQNVKQTQDTPLSLGAVDQRQEAHQTVDVTQDAVSGDDFVNFSQSQNLAQSALNVQSAVQKQNVRPGAPNMDAHIKQRSNAGDNELQSAQTIVLGQNATSVLGPIAQTQGATGGGERATIDVDSILGHGNFDADQTKRWNQTATSLGTVTQIQDDLELLSGLGRTTNTCTVDQITELNADHADAQQRAIQEVRVSAKDRCEAHQRSTIDGQQTNNSGAGKGVSLTNTCEPGHACDTEQHPLSKMHKAVRNVSDEQSFGGLETPNSTTATPGEVIEYQLTYRNLGQAPATGVSIHDQVRPHSSFSSCSSSCSVTGGGGPGSTVTWNLGTVAAGSSVVVTVRTVLDATFPNGQTQIDNTAGGASAEEPPFASNQVSVIVAAGPASMLSKDVRNVSAEGSYGSSAIAGAGDEIEFRLHYVNAGTAIAHDVVVTDHLPSAFTYESGSCSGGCSESEDESGVVLTWAFGDVAPGASATLTIPMAVEPSSESDENVGTVSSTEEGALSSNVASVTVLALGDGATAAGTGLRNRDGGDISIVDVPAGATVTRAVLTWSVQYTGTQPSGDIVFDGHPVTADVNEGQTGGDLCWGEDGTIGFAADVTGFVSGNGSYEITGFPSAGVRVDGDNTPTGFPVTEGASLFVIYRAPGLASIVVSDFSYGVTTDGVVDRWFGGFTASGAGATLIVAGPDGQTGASETLTITGDSSLVFDSTFDGSDPIRSPDFPGGNLWDTDVLDAAPAIGPGTSSVSLALDGIGDCVGLAGAVLIVDGDAGPIYD